MAGRYTKQQWQSGTLLAPYGPVSGGRMNHIEDGIGQIFDDFDAHTVQGNAHPAYILKPGITVTDGAIIYDGSGYVLKKITNANLDPGFQFPAGVPAGAGAMWFSDVAPSGWRILDGSTMVNAATTNPALFANIDPAWKSGNDIILPDCRGRVPVGKGTHADVDALNDNDGAAVGSRRPRHRHTVGAPSHSLSLPAHGHAVGDPGHPHAIQRAQGGGGATNQYQSLPGLSGTQNGSYVNIPGEQIPAAATGVTVGNPTTFPAINGGIGAAAVGPQTGAEPLDTVSYITVNWIIKL